LKILKIPGDKRAELLDNLETNSQI